MVLIKTELLENYQRRQIENLSNKHKQDIPGWQVVET
jgi:hypothetical protein